MKEVTIMDGDIPRPKKQKSIINSMDSAVVSLVHN